MRPIFAAFLLAIVASLALPDVADAQRKRPRKVKKYDFTGDNVEGDVLLPEGVSIDIRGFATHASLIRIRQSFMKEILKETEDL